MKITFLGTCSGTEPVAGFRHISFIVEHHGNIYWFDAGENCSYAAWTGGKDIRKTRAVFISHTHMDHIGGLPNLFWNLRKLNNSPGVSPKGALTGKTFDVFIPDSKTLPAVLNMLSHTEGGFNIDFSINGHIFGDGVIFDEDGFKVEAMRNSHLTGEDGTPLSFSFRIEADDSVLVYSGDTGSPEETAPLIRDADLLLFETGHHAPRDVCEYFSTRLKDSARLGLVHHGRAILNDFEGEKARLRDIMGEKVFIAVDGMEYSLDGREKT